MNNVMSSADTNDGIWHLSMDLALIREKQDGKFPNEEKKKRGYKELKVVKLTTYLSVENEDWILECGVE